MQKLLNGAIACARARVVAEQAQTTDLAKMLASIPEQQRAALVKAIPFRRFGKPSEVADAIVFFASSRADYVTGQVLSVSGGLTMVD